MDLWGIQLPTYAVAVSIAAMLAVVLGIRIVFAWRHHRFAEKPHYSVYLTLLLSHTLTYTGLAVMAVYVLTRGLLSYYFMDLMVTVLFCGAGLALASSLLMAFGSDTELTQEQANSTFFLQSLPGLVGLLTALYALASVFLHAHPLV